MRSLHVVNLDDKMNELHGAFRKLLRATRYVIENCSKYN